MWAHIEMIATRRSKNNLKLRCRHMPALIKGSKWQARQLWHTSLNLNLHLRLSDTPARHQIQHTAETSNLNYRLSDDRVSHFLLEVNEWISLLRHSVGCRQLFQSSVKPNVLLALPNSTSVVQISSQQAQSGLQENICCQHRLGRYKNHIPSSIK